MQSSVERSKVVSSLFFFARRKLRNWNSDLLKLPVQVFISFFRDSEIDDTGDRGDGVWKMLVLFIFCASGVPHGRNPRYTSGHPDHLQVLAAYLMKARHAYQLERPGEACLAELSLPGF